MSNPTCETCRWYRDFNDGAEPNLGTCHRHAPRPVDESQTDDAITVWPGVAANDFRGEHATREESPE